MLYQQNYRFKVVLESIYIIEQKVTSLALLLDY